MIIDTFLFYVKAVDYLFGNVMVYFLDSLEVAPLGRGLGCSVVGTHLGNGFLEMLPRQIPSIHFSFGLPGHLKVLCELCPYLLQVVD